MRDFLFKVLGANSATPLPDRFPSSFILQHNQHRYLLDCGEGAQIKMSEFRIKRSKIDYIFISHLHGDHIFGLPGLLNSFALNGRKKALIIYGPIGLSRYIRTVLDISGAHSSFHIDIRELDGYEHHDLGEIDQLRVLAFPLKHRIPTLGYRFDELQGPPKIDPTAIGQYELSIGEIKAIKKGEDIIRGSKSLPPTTFTAEPRPLRSFAYCTDTIYDPEIIPVIDHVNLLYHEATYLHDLAGKARLRMHATVREAATIAHQANAGQLVLGHYSGRYKDLSPLLKEATEAFPNSHMAIEGEVFEID